MAIAADISLCLKNNAKVVYFCEPCKQKIRIVHTINVNANHMCFIHKSAIHKSCHTSRFPVSFTKQIKKSRVAAHLYELLFYLPKSNSQ